MKLLTIDGHFLRKAIIHAVNKLEENKEIINALNVFPVPDGDTGNNMAATAQSAAKAVAALDTADIYEVAKAASSGALRGARGNSGVILSQLFRGFAKGLEGKKEATAYNISNAFLLATEASYKAVMKPKEGTILTIGKALAEAGETLAKKEDDIKVLLEGMLKSAHKMLIKTEFMLPELRSAGVVDSGGKGLLYMIEGMLEADYSEDVTLAASIASKSSEVSVFGGDVDIEFGYCTEMFIDLDTGPNKLTFENVEDPLKEYLDTMGDSIVVVGDENIVKIHIHTNDPGMVMQKSLTYGQLSNIKIENMRLQHEELVSFADVKSSTTPKKFNNHVLSDEINISTNYKKIAVIAVSSGDGFTNIFNDLGVDYCISGGQTMNPSTEDFLTAIEKINAENIIILPNNSNIILAAEQAAKIQNKNKSNKKIYVVPSKTIPAGIGAMYNYNPDITAEEIFKAMSDATSNVSTGEVTFAVRDTNIDGITIKKDDILCILNNKIICTKKTPEEGAKAIVEAMMEKELEFLNIYYGEDGSEEEAINLKNYIEKENDSIEIEVYEGSQPLYHYIISAE